MLELEGLQWLRATPPLPKRFQICSFLEPWKNETSFVLHETKAFTKIKAVPATYRLQSRGVYNQAVKIQISDYLNTD